MRISDWSSDVCSSDLLGDLAVALRLERLGNDLRVRLDVVGDDRLDLAFAHPAAETAAKPEGEGEQHGDAEPRQPQPLPGYAHAPSLDALRRSAPKSTRLNSSH